MTQETLRVLLRSSIPAFHILVTTFPILQRQKVEKDGRISAIRIGIFPSERSEEKELLRCRIRNGGQDDSADSNAEIESGPANVNQV